MTRRKLLLSAAGLLAGLAVPAAARNVESDVADRLAREGFRITRRSRTWLGRVRIEAARGKQQREIVLDPTTGEILRDYTDGSGGVQVASRDPGPGAGGSTAGSAGEGGGAAPDDGPPEEPAKEPGKKPSKEPGKEPSKEPEKEPESEPEKEPEKEAGAERSKGRSKGRRSKSKESAGVRE